MFCLCPEDIFEEIIFFFTKSSKFSVVFRLWGNISDFWQNYSSWVVKTVFLVSRRHFWRNNILFHKTFKFFSCFQTLRKTFWIIGENILLGLSKLFSSVQGVFLEEFIFENIILEFFLYFWSSGANFLYFQRKFCDRFLKTAFFVYSGDFWLDIFFYESFEFFHRLRAVKKTFWHFGAKTSKSLLKLQFMWTKIFCGKFDFWRKNFYNFFEYWSKILRLLTKMLSNRKILSNVIFSSEKIHVFLRKLREKVFGVR